MAQGIVRSIFPCSILSVQGMYAANVAAAACLKSNCQIYQWQCRQVLHGLKPVSNQAKPSHKRLAYAMYNTM
jgi:hypothetical protein